MLLTHRLVEIGTTPPLTSLGKCQDDDSGTLVWFILPAILADSPSRVRQLKAFLSSSNSLCSGDTYPQRMKVGPWHRWKFTTHAPDFGALDKIKGHDPFMMHSWHTESWGRRTYRWRSAWATSDPQNQSQNRGGEDKREEEKQGQEQEEDWLGPLLGKRCLTVVEVWHGPQLAQLCGLELV